MPPTASIAENSPRPHGERLILALVLALAAIAGVGGWFATAALAHHDQVQGTAPDRPRQLGNFSLVDSTGRAVNRGDVEGKVLAVSFLFTGCGLTCPEVTRRMAEIQQLTTNLPDVRLLSLTVDPRSDTPPVLAQWGARYGADPSRWWLLTGGQAALQGLIADSFLATNATDPFNTMPGNFTGAERIAVVDKHGRVRVYFDGLRLETTRAVVAEIEQLRKED